MIDFFSNNLVFNEWSCFPSGNAQCNRHGLGNIEEFISLPSENESITYQVISQIVSDEFEEISYEIRVEVSEPQFDIGTTNNSYIISTLDEIIFNNGFQ